MNSPEEVGFGRGGCESTQEVGFHMLLEGPRRSLRATAEQEELSDKHLYV